METMKTSAVARAEGGRGETNRQNTEIFRVIKVL